MRRTSVLLTATAAALLALPAPTVAAAPIPAATPAGPVVTSVALSTGAVTVTGLDTVTVTATVTTTGDTGPCIAAGWDGFVLLTRTSSHVWDRSATGWLVGGTSCVSDSGGVRTWRADIVVPSTADGAWRVSDVDFGNGDDQDPSGLGLPDPTLVVTGQHRPRLRFSMKPQSLAYPRRTATFTVQASFDDTHAPIAGRWISVWHDAAGPDGCDNCSGTTDAKGRLVRAVTLTDSRQLLAQMPIGIVGPYDWSPDYSFLYAYVVVQPALSAAPSMSSARHGRNVDVTGRAVAVGVPYWPLRPRTRVGLQRLVGRHWRTVSEGTIRQNGRFTLVATPPKGRNLYRAAFPKQQTFVSATSRTFVIRGT